MQNICSLVKKLGQKGGSFPVNLATPHMVLYKKMMSNIDSAKKNPVFHLLHAKNRHEVHFFSRLWFEPQLKLTLIGNFLTMES